MYENCYDNERRMDTVSSVGVEIAQIYLDFKANEGIFFCIILGDLLLVISCLCVSIFRFNCSNSIYVAISLLPEMTTSAAEHMHLGMAVFCAIVFIKLTQIVFCCCYCDYVVIVVQYS